MSNRDLLLDLKERLNLTNEQLAERLGVSRRTVQSWLRGGRVSARYRQVIAVVYNK